jgi:hypothetical protein
VPAPRVVLTLLAEAKGVPVIFAVLLPSGNVVLEVRHCTFQTSCKDWLRTVLHASLIMCVVSVWTGVRGRQHGPRLETAGSAAS